MKQNDGLKKSAKWLRVACIGVAAGLGALGNAHALATIEPPPEQAVWVFSDINSPANPVSNPVARQALISNSAASRVKALYVSVYRSTRAQPISNAGRLMYEDADMADLIAKAHAQGMTVLAAYGAPKWPSLGCSVNAFPLARLDEVAAYNHANPKAAFDGVMLDIEPSAPIDFVALLTQYRCFLTAAQASNLKLGAAIRLGWKDIVIFEGISKEFYKHVLDMLPLDSRVVVMGYRDFAGTSAPGSDGIIASNQDQFAYAASIGKKQMMLAGLETSDLAATGTANKKMAPHQSGFSTIRADNPSRPGCHGDLTGPGQCGQCQTAQSHRTQQAGESAQAERPLAL